MENKAGLQSICSSVTKYTTSFHATQQCLKKVRNRLQILRELKRINRTYICIILESKFVDDLLRKPLRAFVTFSFNTLQNGLRKIRAFHVWKTCMGAW